MKLEYGYLSQAGQIMTDCQTTIDEKRHQMIAAVMHFKYELARDGQKFNTETLLNVAESNQWIEIGLTKKILTEASWLIEKEIRAGAFSLQDDEKIERIKLAVARKNLTEDLGVCFAILFIDWALYGRSLE